mmetsp:Transcript_103950/g.271409  ORF Transcript_103950/g.271409 Transcript_103950/m.271409 type:complete len:213 (+) Transcript_103950:1010-1648(+)
MPRVASLTSASTVVVEVTVVPRRPPSRPPRSPAPATPTETPMAAFSPDVRPPRGAGAGASMASTGGASMVSTGGASGSGGDAIMRASLESTVGGTSAAAPPPAALRHSSSVRPHGQPSGTSAGAAGRPPGASPAAAAVRVHRAGIAVTFLTPGAPLTFTHSCEDAASTASIACHQARQVPTALWLSKSTPVQNSCAAHTALHISRDSVEKVK